MNKQNLGNLKVDSPSILIKQKKKVTPNNTVIVLKFQLDYSDDDYNEYNLVETHIR